jgi:hypothetical protein
MPRLIRLDSGDEIGNVNDDQLKFLVDQLEGEAAEDKEYFIDKDTLELLSDNGADPELLALLEKGLAGDEDMTVAWD